MGRTMNNRILFGIFVVFIIIDIGLYAYSNIPKVSYEHPIGCNITVDDDRIRVLYLGGRDDTFVRSLQIYLDGEQVVKTPYPKAYGSWNVTMKNTTSRIVVTATDAAINCERVIANVTVTR